MPKLIGRTSCHDDERDAGRSTPVAPAERSRRPGTPRLRRMRITVLDDYQQVAHRFADWASLEAEVQFQPEHHADPAGLAAALAGVDVVVAMRERTPFTAEV